MADDEPLVRIALREMIAWEEHECEVVAEASDGAEALRLLEREGGIDLVVIDIRMPEMDGIEFLERLGRMDMPAKPLVVVLSAYPEYDYVRQAFLLGAVDYIVKATMEQGPMNAVIRKAAARLKDRLQQDDRLRKERQAERLKLREQAVMELLSGVEGPARTALASDVDWLRWLREAEASEQAVACIEVDMTGSQAGGAGPDDQTARYILHTVRQAADESGHAEALVLRMGAQEFALLITFAPSAAMSLHKRRIRLAETIDRAVSHLKQYLNLSAWIGVSDAVRGPSGWNERYAQAREWVRLRFYEPERKVFYPEHGVPTAEEARLQADPWDRKPLLRALENGEPWEEEWARGIRYWRSFRTRPGAEVKQSIRTLLWEIGALLGAHGFDWDALSEQDPPPPERLLQMNRLAEIEQWLSDLAGKAASLLDPRRRAADSSPRLVDKAIRYIERHYPEPISLGQVSEWIGVSESHLSKQFAKETGENFIVYLTRLRVRKAIELMGGGMKLFEIAERVGYPNPEYFSRIFKKMTGRTPQQYRDEMRP
nr:response regulator [Cohnella sp. CFH 77786]